MHAVLTPHLPHYFEEGLLQLREIQRLDQMAREPGLLGAADIFIHPVTAQGDSPYRAGGPQFFQQVKTASIGQAEIADQHVERSAVPGLDRAAW